MESVGANVAVIVALPAPETVRVDPLTETTEAVSDAYENEPESEPATVGAVTM